MTPGAHAKHDLAGALDPLTGTLHDCLGARQTHALFRDLLDSFEERYPAEPYTRLFVPTYGPRANPIERAFGDVHDGCTRNHQRQRLAPLVVDVEDHLRLNGPWKYALPDLYNAPAVTTAIERIAAEEQAKVTA